MWLQGQELVWILGCPMCLELSGDVTGMCFVNFSVCRCGG